MASSAPRCCAACWASCWRIPGYRTYGRDGGSRPPIAPCSTAPPPVRVAPVLRPIAGRSILCCARFAERDCARAAARFQQLTRRSPPRRSRTPASIAGAACCRATMSASIPPPSPSTRCLPPSHAGAPSRLAARAAGHRHPRPQARRGRARAARGAERHGGRMGEPAAGMGRGQSAARSRHVGREEGSGRRRRCAVAADRRRRLALRSRVRRRCGRRAFAERLVAWQQKALREAKLASDWAAIDEAYEAAARDFTVALVAARRCPTCCTKSSPWCSASPRLARSMAWRSACCA